jgi:hypothetical protein
LSEKGVRTLLSVPHMPIHERILSQFAEYEGCNSRTPTLLLPFRISLLGIYMLSDVGRPLYTWSGPLVMPYLLVGV